MQHGKCGGVNGSHIVSYQLPVGRTFPVSAHVVAHRDDVALIVRIIGHSCCTECLAAGHLMSGDHIILKAGLMGRSGRLHLKLIYLSVELHESDRIVSADEMFYIPRLRHGLVTIIPVKIIAARTVAGVMHTGIYVLLRHEDEKYVVQKICHGNSGLLRGIITVEPFHLA